MGLNMSRWMLKDWVFLILAIAGVSGTFYFGLRQSEINRIIREIQHDKNFSALPQNIQTKIDKIETVSSDSGVVFNFGQQTSN